MRWLSVFVYGVEFDRARCVATTEYFQENDTVYGGDYDSSTHLGFIHDMGSVEYPK